MEGLLRMGDEGSSSSIEHVETSTLDSQARSSTATEWTDEKHSLYLKSMEASFVNQLYKSFDLLGSRSHTNCSSHSKSSRQMHAITRTPSGQFKVLQDGCWGKIYFKRDELHLKNADESRVLSANPWIRHFRSGSRHQVLTSPAVQEKAALDTTSTQLPVSHTHLCRQDSIGSSTEVTDQNFVDDDVERENAGRMCSTKRMKTSVVASSSNDQVVPLGKFPVTEDVAENRVFPEE